MRCFLVLVVITLVCLSGCFSCNNSKKFEYHLHDCSEDETPVGVYKVSQDGKVPENVKPVRRRRSVEESSCIKKTMNFLTRNKDLNANIATDVTPAIVAGNFVYYYYVSPNKIFYGVENVVKAIKTNKTVNIVWDESIDFLVLNIRRNYNNPQTDIRFMKKTDYKPSEFKGFYSVECQNLMSYLSNFHRPVNWSITKTNYLASNHEFRFKQLTGGVGGFF